MNDEQIEMLASEIIDIVDEYEGLGGIEAAMMQKEIVTKLKQRIDEAR